MKVKNNILEIWIIRRREGFSSYREVFLIVDLFVVRIKKRRGLGGWGAEGPGAVFTEKRKEKMMRQSRDDYFVGKMHRSLRPTLSILLYNPQRLTTLFLLYLNDACGDGVRSAWSGNSTSPCVTRSS